MDFQNAQDYHANVRGMSVNIISYIIIITKRKLNIKFYKILYLPNQLLANNHDRLACHIFR